MGLFQIDSVNVLARAHYIPAFSRIGAYDMTIIDAMAYRRRELFEYWGHEASLLPVEVFPLMRWKMDEGSQHHRYLAWAEKNAAFVREVHAQVAERGPLGVSDLTDPGTRRGPWWGWAEGKTALEWLFVTGQVTTAARRNFERLYDLTERVIPQRFFEAPHIAEPDARKRLLLLAASSLGVATDKDLADYYRMNLTAARSLIRELIEEGSLRVAKVEGWGEKAYVPASFKVPRHADASALVCPFDPLVWRRERTERIFGMRYRIEIYVPQHKRVFGYYVLPFLCDSELAARVDLKADRARSALLVKASHLEDGKTPRSVAHRLARELSEMASWLGLERIEVAANGSLSRALRAEVRSGLST